MAKRKKKKAARKKSTPYCKKCRRKFVSMHALGKHYRENESHRPNTPWHQQKGAVAKPKRSTKKATAPSGHSINLCPCCGFPIAVLQALMEGK